LVPDDSRTIALGQSIARTDERPASDEGAYEPDARTDEPDTGSKRPVQRTTRPGRRKYRTGTVDEPSTGRTDRAALEAAARTVHAALADEGTPLTRDALATRLRDAGHTVSNSRASDLVKLLRANTVGVNGSGPGVRDEDRP